MLKVKIIIKLVIISVLIIILLPLTFIKIFEIPIILNYNEFDKYITKGYCDSYEFKNKLIFSTLGIKKYLYDTNSYKKICNNYGMVTDENINKIKMCFDDFYEKFKFYNIEHNFNTNSLNVGDYIYISNLKVNNEGNFKNYKIYFFDVETDTLYYIYSN